MKVLLDANVWIDIAVRPAKYPDSVRLLHELESRAFAIGFPLCAYTTLYYVLSRLIGKQGAITFLELLAKRGIRMLSFTARDVEAARGFPFNDHEDACVAATAFNSKYDVIATRDIAGYKSSPVTARTPSVLLQNLSP